MRIGIDARSLMDSHFSGVSLYAYNLIQALLENDKKNEYCLFFNNFKHFDPPDFGYSGLKKTALHYPNKIFNYLMQNVLSLPKIDQLTDADIFFMPHINFIALKGSGKLILTIHDLSYLRYPEFFSRRKNFWHHMVNVKKLSRQADLIVAVSENTKSDIIELIGISEEKIRVIYSGANVQENAAKNGGTSFEAGLPPNYFLFVGSIEPRKNIESIIAAYRQMLKNDPGLQDFKLILAGPPGWKNKTVINALNFQSAKNIIYFGYIDQRAKELLYKNCTALLFPSYYEGFGFPPLEARLFGKPVIASFSASIPEIIGKNAIYIDPYNTNDIVQAMLMVCKSHEAGRVLCNNSLEEKKIFSWNIAAKNYIQIFNGIIC